MPSTINADNGVVSGSSGVKTTADTSGVLALQSNGSTGLTLDTSLNVGIGVTPSAWRSAFNVTYGERALEVTYSALVTQAGPSTILANNVYFNSSNQWIYKNAVANTNAGLYTIGSNGVHSWSVAPTGASGAVATFTQAMTLDASGNLGIGTSSPQSRLHVSDAVAGGQLLVTNNETNNGAKIGSLATMHHQNAEEPVLAISIEGGASENILQIGGGPGEFNAATVIKFSTAANTTTTGGSERARFDSSGKLLVATTTVIDSARMTIKGSATVINAQTETDGSYVLRVTNSAGSGVGGVVANASSTSYLTSSDYRLKNTITPMTGALSKVTQLKPCTYKWNVDGSDGQGFIAHELAEVCPDAVSGEKDATRIEEYEISPAVKATFDEQGNELTPAVSAVMGEREVPVYQGVDTSFLVATLTAAIQELKAEFDAYKASHP